MQTWQQSLGNSCICDYTFDLHLVNEAFGQLLLSGGGGK